MKKKQKFSREELNIYLRLAAHCVEVSKVYWSLDPLWYFEFEENAKDGSNTYAQINVQPAYQRAYIDLNTQKYESLERQWKTVAHEVIHVLLGEFEVIREALGHYESNKKKLESQMWRVAEERTTERLLLRFLKDNPYHDGLLEQLPKVEGL